MLGEELIIQCLRSDYVLIAIYIALFNISHIGYFFPEVLMIYRYFIRWQLGPVGAG